MTSIAYFVVLIILQVLNIHNSIEIEKKVCSLEDVDPQLQNKPIEDYRKILQARSINEIMEMYRTLYEAKRRKVDISMKTVYDSIFVALLPILLDKILEASREVEVRDFTMMSIVAIYAIPLLIEVIITIFDILEEDKIRSTVSIEKYVQDSIVKELVGEYLDNQRKN